MQQLPKITFWQLLSDAKGFGFVRRAAVGAEQNIHEWGDVGVVAGLAFARVMPMMKFGRADEPSQGSDGKSDVGMDVDGPDAAEGEESGERFEWEAQKECGKVDEAHGIDGIERMLAMGSQPIEVLGAVMDGMKAPKEFEAMLQTMSPIDKEVAEKNHFDGLKPPGLRSDCAAQGDRNDSVQPATEILKYCEDASAPEKILAEEEGEVGEPSGTKKGLRSGRERFFQRRKEQRQEEKAEAGAQDGKGDEHLLGGLHELHQLHRSDRNRRSV